MTEKTEPDSPPRCSAKDKEAKRKSSCNKEHKRNIRNARGEKML